MSNRSAFRRGVVVEQLEGYDSCRSRQGEGMHGARLVGMARMTDGASGAFGAGTCADAGRSSTRMVGTSRARVSRAAAEDAGRSARDDSVLGFAAMAKGSGERLGALAGASASSFHPTSVASTHAEAT